MAISNNSTGLRPGVCLSTTRPTAPYEGQTIYETDTDLTYVWGGSAWQQVSGGTAVGNSGLVYITSSTIGTAVSTHVVSNVFNSTYDNYKIVVTNMKHTASGGNFYIALSGSSGWYSNVNWMQAGSASWGLDYILNGSRAFIGITDTNTMNWICEVTNPYVAVAKSVMNTYTSSGSNLYVGSGLGVSASTNSATDFTISLSSGTMTGGTVTVYGYRNS